MQSKTQSLRPESTIGGAYLQHIGAKNSSAWTEEKIHCVWGDSSIQAKFQDQHARWIDDSALSKQRQISFGYLLQKKTVLKIRHENEPDSDPDSPAV